MASAYAAIENKGVFREPTCIMAITDSEGNEVVTDDIFDEKRIYDKDAAMMMTDVLRGVLTKGTARGYELDGVMCRKDRILLMNIRTDGLPDIRRIIRQSYGLGAIHRRV